MAKKQSATVDMNDTTVAPKERKKKAPAEVINLPLRGGIIETIRRVAKVYKVPVSSFMSRFAVEIEPYLIDIAKKIVGELETERAQMAASVFDAPSVEPVNDADPGIPISPATDELRDE